jgi:short-subunit dehydrogenase
MEVSILVNNAGFGFQGSFAELDLQSHLDLIQVNITTLAQLTHLFLKPMLARRSGRILNVASTAALLPGPFMGMYYASKALVLSFSRALAEELAGTGVTVTALCPGVTRSQFHARAGLNRQAKFITMDADAVARIGYRALMAGKPVVIAGWVNKLGAMIMKFMPAQWLAKAAAKINRPPARR